MEEVAVAVVGGGVTGLAAAWELRRRDVPFLLLERSPRLGGMIRTETADGFVIDAGPDSLLAHKPAALALCREVGLGPRLVPTLAPRTAWVLRGGRLRPLARGSVLGIPTRVGALAAGGPLGWRGRLRMAADLATPPRASDEDESVAAFFRRRFGAEAVDWLAEPLLAGIHAGDVERLSVGALFPMLVEAERTAGSVMRGLRRRQAERARRAAGDNNEDGGNEDGGNEDAGPFRSLPGGLGALVDAVARQLPPASVRLDCGVESIGGRGPFRLETRRGPVVAQQVLLALPGPPAAGLLGPLDAEAARLLGAIRHTSSATVALAYPRAAVGRRLRGSGFVVPRAERGVSLLAATSVSSKWPGRAPDDQWLFRGFLGGARDPQALAADDDHLAATVHRDLARLLAITAEPTLTRVYRWPNANPQHEVGHQARVAAIDARLARLPALHVAGPALRGVGIPDCIAAGRRAAAAAADALPPAPGLPLPAD